MIEITPELREELRRKATAAMPGPWRWDENKQLVSDAEVDSEGDPETVINDPYVFHWRTGEDDRAYIAAANPAIVLALLDKIDALETQLDHERMGGRL